MHQERRAGRNDLDSLRGTRRPRRSRALPILLGAMFVTSLVTSLGEHA
jgi:hypothetical protein